MGISEPYRSVLLSDPHALPHLQQWQLGRLGRLERLVQCNQLQRSELDPSFALPAEAAAAEGVERLPFDALLLAEGEWSDTCKRLGVSKSVREMAERWPRCGRDVAKR